MTTTNLDQGNANNTKLVAPVHAGPKLVKVRAILACQAAPGQEPHSPGDVFEVTEAQADELCRVLDGPYSFGGERIGGGSTDRHKIVRAERVRG